MFYIFGKHLKIFKKRNFHNEFYIFEQINYSFIKLIRIFFIFYY